MGLTPTNERAASGYIHKHRATLASTTPRLQARSERSRSTAFIHMIRSTGSANSQYPLFSYVSLLVNFYYFGCVYGFFQHFIDFLCQIFF